MITRRDFLQATVALGALGLGVGAGFMGWRRFAARQQLSQDDILQFDDFGNVTLLHFADLHAQLKPIYYREPSQNIGSGGVRAKHPHLTGRDFLTHYNLSPGTPYAYALSSDDFAGLAKTYGKMGGLDRLATVIHSIREVRDEKVLLLDGGDSWQGSYCSYKTQGADVIEALSLLNIDAMTGHWEFTFGRERVQNMIEGLGFPFLGGNVIDATWDEPVLEPIAYFERGGVKIAVIGQAFPYTPVAHPKWLMPNWSFGIREQQLQANVEAALAAGAQLVVLLSHNGLAVDAKLASRVKGLDVILSAHTHDAFPEALKVKDTMIVASGSNGKFISRLDLDIGTSGGVKGFRYKLMPIFADVIAPDNEMGKLVDKLRAPHSQELGRVIGKTDKLLYRRGTFNGTYDDLICAALMSELDAEIALSPGFRWGTSVLPQAEITIEALFNATALSYPATYRTEMSGAQLKTILEDVADNLFNADPYYTQGGDMVRVGGLAFEIKPSAKIGSRVLNMVLLRSGLPIEPTQTYSVAGWASVNEQHQGAPIWEVVERYLRSPNAGSQDVVRKIKVV